MVLSVLLLYMLFDNDKSAAYDSPRLDDIYHGDSSGEYLRVGQHVFWGCRVIHAFLARGAFLKMTVCTQGWIGLCRNDTLPHS